MTDVAQKLAVVIPMFNEERNVAGLFARLLPVCTALGRPFEIICVDDGSKDHTAELVRGLQNKHPEIVLVRFARNFGQHAAITAGFAQVSADWVITLDADLQNPPEEIPNLVCEFARGHDLINTVRVGRQDTFFRKRASRFTNALVRRISGIRLNDFGCMLRGYSSEVAKGIVRSREYRTFIPALATLFARNPVEINVAHAARAEGESKYSLLKLFSLQLDLITSFSVHPLRALFLVGTGLAALGLLLGALILILRIIYGSHWAGDGTLTVLGILMIFTGLQFFAFGLLGEYIGRIFQQVREREHYVVQGVDRAGDPGQT